MISDHGGLWKASANSKQKVAMSSPFKEAWAMQYSVSHVRAQLAGAKDLKEETAECVTVLYLSFGYIRRAGSAGRGEKI